MLFKRSNASSKLIGPLVQEFDNIVLVKKFQI